MTENTKPPAGAGGGPNGGGPSGAGSGPGSPGSGNKAVVIAVLAVVALAVGLVVMRSRMQPSRELITPKQIAARGPIKTVEMTVPLDATLDAAWLDVNQPVALRQAAEKNQWLQEVLASPLGRGFSASWTAFFSSKGEDFGAGFKGSVAAFFFDKLLAQPFSIVWFGGDGTTGAPALVVDAPSSAATAALAVLETAAGRGAYSVTHCPGDSAPPPGPPKEPGGEPVPPLAKYTIVRLSIGEQALFAASTDKRLVFAAKPTAALHGLCVDSSTHKRGSAALELSARPERFGREAQTLGAVVGLGEELRLAFALTEAGALTPLGIAAPLAAAGRLGTAALSDDLLKLIPEDMPMAAAFVLNLPEQLNQTTLAAHLKANDKGASGKVLARQVAVVWNPHGTRGTPEIALLWGRQEDEAALKAIFSGPNALLVSKACAHLVFASTKALSDRLERSCRGATPSRANAAPTIVSGAKVPSSIGVHLNLPAFADGLLNDAYTAERRAQDKGKPPPEIEDARAKLRALPFFGFRGKVEGAALVGEGFRS